MADNFEINRAGMPLWRWAELSAGLTQTEVPGPEVHRVIVDSRLSRPGDLFIALPGDPGLRFNPSYRSAVDGHDFVSSAADAGAVGALVHKHAADIDTPEGFPLLQVSDTYDGLWALGRLARTRLRGDVIAITGSSGKTTAKQFLSAALDGYAPPGSLNNHIGVPLSLANAVPTANSCVFEIGTNHPGEIEPLAQMIEADVAVLLNVHSAHIENFIDWQSLKEEKISIFNHLRDKRQAIHEDVLSLDFGYSFGLSKDAHARVLGVKADIAQIDLFGQRLSARIPGGGVHRAATVAATLLVLQLLGRDVARGCELPSTLIPKGRGDIRRVSDVVVVDESYNANPDSMAASLASFASLQGSRRRIAVLGEMLELGGLSGDAHMGLAPMLADFDLVICVGGELRALAESLGVAWFEEASDALMQLLLAELEPQDAVLLKGSNRVFWAEQFVDRLVVNLEQK